MHLSASQFCHQGTGCHRIGDALLLSLFVGCYQIAQTEGLGCLGTDQFVARNTGVGRKTIFALQDSLSTFDTRNGIAILLADGMNLRCTRSNANKEDRRPKYAMPKAIIDAFT